MLLLSYHSNSLLILKQCLIFFRHSNCRGSVKENKNHLNSSLMTDRYLSPDYAHENGSMKLQIWKPLPEIFPLKAINNNSGSTSSHGIPTPKSDKGQTNKTSLPIIK